MNNVFLFVLMIFLHIVDDYYLQGWLASAKQKKYWEDNAPEPMYQHDYVWALIMHSFSWSFMVMLPIALNNGFVFGFTDVLLLVVNLIIHAFVDDLKANKRKINLWTDQTVHILQIIITAIVLL